MKQSTGDLGRGVLEKENNPGNEVRVQGKAVKYQEQCQEVMGVEKDTIHMSIQVGVVRIIGKEKGMVMHMVVVL